jgi:tubulin polyglutamylase TTLL1
VLLDEKCRPWLIEINASPSLSTNSAKDKILKKTLISDLIDVVIPTEFTEETVK